MEKPKLVRPGDAPENGFYRHWKRTDDMAEGEFMYEVIGVGPNTETGDIIVSYRPLYKSQVYCAGMIDNRPLHDKDGNGFMDPKRTEDGIVDKFVRVTDQEEIKRLSYIRDKMYK